MKIRFSTFVSVSLLCAVLVPGSVSGDSLGDFVELSRLREKKLNAELIPACESFLKAHPKSSADDDVRFYLAQAHFNLKAYDKAIAAATVALERHPKSGIQEQITMMRGEAYRNKKDYRGSLPDFKKVFDLANPTAGANAAHAQYHVVQAHYFLKQLDKAQAALDTLKEKYPKSSYVKTATTLLKAKAKAKVLASAPKPRGLKPGTVAPDIGFEILTDGSKAKLSDFRGKIVVLDFWASWCGPCQAPMAKMQTYREKHSDWGDKVELIALSIDAKRADATNHLKKRGWDKTLNVWAGEGGFRSDAPTNYGIRGIPTVYVIDAEGKVAVTGHPSRVDVPAVVDKLMAGN
jgi:thiol-disulfide isomerase/thioredoxin